MSVTNVETGPLMLVVAAALVARDGRVLVQQRPAGKAMAGLWEFPGGKVEPGETPEVALRRELGEELDIDVALGAMRPLAFASEPVGARRMLLLLYIVREWTRTPRAIEATAFFWGTPQDLAGLPMPPADEPFIPALAAAI